MAPRWRHGVGEAVARSCRFGIGRPAPPFLAAPSGQRGVVGGFSARRTAIGLFDRRRRNRPARHGDRQARSDVAEPRERDLGRCLLAERRPAGLRGRSIGHERGKSFALGSQAERPGRRSGRARRACLLHCVLPKRRVSILRRRRGADSRLGCGTLRSPSRSGTSPSRRLCLGCPTGRSPTRLGRGRPRDTPLGSRSDRSSCDPLGQPRSSGIARLLARRKTPRVGQCRRAVKIWETAAVGISGFVILASTTLIPDTPLLRTRTVGRDSDGSNSGPRPR